MSRPPGDARALQLLESISARLARLEARLEPAAQALDAAPAALATLADILDEKISNPAEVETRLRALLPVLERLTRPETLSALSKVVDLVEQAPLGLATLTDTLDQVMAEAGEQGLRTERLIPGVQRAASAVAKLFTSDEFVAVLDSGILDARVLPTLGAMARALSNAANETAPKLGPLGTLRAMRRPEVQSALGFMMSAAFEFGAALPEPHSRGPLTPEPKKLEE